MAAQNGGGTFLVVYILIVLLFGVVMLSTEIALGRKTRKSPPDAYASLNPRARWIGVLSTLVPTFILPYYCVIGGWILDYMGAYAFGISASGTSFFSDLAGSWTAVVLFAVFFVLTMAVIWMGVSNGIERLARISMPLLLIMIVVLAAYTLMQPGMADGLSYYLSFDLSEVSGETFTSALGQAFFSLSLAMGIMITYGSYMRKEDSIEGCAISIGVIDTIVAVLCGFLIVPMAFYAHSGEIPSGAGLVFQTLPGIFEDMAGGNIVALTFFVLLFIAAWTSAISVAEAVISSIIDKTGMSRKRAICIVFAPMLVAGTVISLGFGPLDFIHIGDRGLLDLIDYFVDSIMMPFVAFAMCIFLGHVVGCKVIENEIESAGKFRLKRIYPFMIKWVAPVFIAVIFLSSIGIW